jgi:Right handed beta helix region/Protein of unknown function (DUF1565)
MDVRGRNITVLVAVLLSVAAAAACSDNKNPDSDSGPDAALEQGVDLDALPPDTVSPDMTAWPTCTKPWVKGAPTCRPKLDTCADDKLPLPGGGCKRVGVKLCKGGIEAPPAWTCQLVGPPTICRKGWSKGTGTRCAPVLPAGPCTSATMPVIGQSVCQPVGDCGSGAYGAIVTSAATRFVDKSYTGGGSDGSKAKPYTSITAALQAAGQGGHVAVAAGQYDEDVALSKQVKLEGRCAKLVTIKGQKSGAFDAAVKITASGSFVRGVAVSGPGMGIYVTGAGVQATVDTAVVSGTGRFGVGADLGAKLTLSDTTVVGSTGLGVYVDGADATLQRVAVRATKPDPTYGDLGYGVAVSYLSAYNIPATLKVVDSVIDENLSVGVFIAAASAALEGTVVRKTQPAASTKDGGIGVAVYTTPKQQGPLTLKESLLAGNRTAGLQLLDAAATVERSVIQDTESQGDILGVGILVERKASSSVLTLRESLLTNNRTAGLLVRGSQATVERSVIEKTRVQASPQVFGYGVQAQTWPSTSGLPSTVTLRDSVVTGNRTAGAVVEDSTLVALRSVFSQSLPRLSDKVAGFGVAGVGQSGTATLELTDCLVADNRTVGVVLVNAKAKLERTLIRDTTAEDSGGEFGHGLTAQYLAGTVQPELTLRECVVTRSVEAGISLYDASATIQGSLVQATKIGVSSAGFGDGISMVRDKLTGTTMSLTDSLVSDSARAGLYLSGVGGQVHQSTFSGGIFSVVREHKATTTLGPSNLYTGNKEDKPRWGDGIPSAKAPAVPAL